MKKIRRKFSSAIAGLLLIALMLLVIPGQQQLRAASLSKLPSKYGVQGLDQVSSDASSPLAPARIGNPLEQRLAASRPVGDVNNDGWVDIDDILAIRGHIFGLRSLPDAALPFADLNGDGVLDIDDILCVRRLIQGFEPEVNHSGEVPGTGFPSPQPTPSGVSQLPVTGIAFDAPSVNLAVGDAPVALPLSILPANATDQLVTFESSDPDIVVVSETGRVTALASGLAEITATSRDGSHTAHCRVFVHENNATVSGGLYMLLKVGTANVLDVYGTGSTSGTEAWMSPYENLNSQRWTASFSGSVLTLIPKSAENCALGIVPTQTGEYDTNCSLNISTKNAAATQEWTLARLYNGTYAIRSKSNPSFCLAGDIGNQSMTIYMTLFDPQSESVMWDFKTAVDTQKTAWVHTSDGKNLNVRSLPSMSGTVIGQFKNGTAITVLGDALDGWYAVRGTGVSGVLLEGFSSADFLRFTMPEEQTFTIRTTVPDKDNAYYYANNIFAQSGYGMPNCTAYAWGRAWELSGTKLPSGYFTGNAHKWWADNQNSGAFAYGSEPKPGAIAVWRSTLPGSGNCGHVAIVENIVGGTVYVSESHYTGDRWFDYRPIYATQYLAGYIYLLEPLK